jgi:hypothetical protein
MIEETYNINLYIQCDRSQFEKVRSLLLKIRKLQKKNKATFKFICTGGRYYYLLNYTKCFINFD